MLIELITIRMNLLQNQLEKLRNYDRFHRETTNLLKKLDGIKHTLEGRVPDNVGKKNVVLIANMLELKGLKGFKDDDEK